MNKMTKRIIIIVGAILLLVGLVIGIVYLVERNKNKVNFQQGIEIEGNILSSQKDVDDMINNMMNDPQYTFDDPMVLNNPYQMSPLTALIIFQTNNDVSYEVFINNNLLTTMESSKKHAIPVYGLISGKENVVTLKGSNGSSKDIKIKTKDFKYNVDINKSSLTSNNEFFFLTSTIDVGHVAINRQGEVVWFLNNKGAQDLEFLSNGHILISNNNVSSSDAFTGFYEIDFLGKIYKSYTLKNGYHHEVNELSDGNLMVAGENYDSKLRDSYIYVIDKETGKELSNVDLYSVIESIDVDFARTLSNKDAINNSIYYNEQSKELILSLRGFNSIMSLNYDNKTINWILGDKEDWSDKFDKYILKSKDGSRLPKGAHTAFITKDGNIGVFNNDYDVNSKKFLLKDFKNNYSSATIYSIDKNDMSYTTSWNYVDDDKVFNYALGSFNELSNNHKLINFGWSFNKKDYDTNTSIYDDNKQSYTRLVELDDNNNIIFRAKLSSNVYRASKNKLYGEKTANYNPNDIIMINTLPYTILDEVTTLSIQDKINNAEDPICDINLDNSVISMNMIFDSLEDVKLVFKSDMVSYIYAYKPANQKVNSKVNLSIKGNFDVYLVIDDKYYKTNAQLNTDNNVITLKSSIPERDE